MLLENEAQFGVHASCSTGLWPLDGSVASLEKGEKGGCRNQVSCGFNACLADVTSDGISQLTRHCKSPITLLQSKHGEEKHVGRAE